MALLENKNDLVGKRIRLIEMSNDPCAIEPDSLGIIQSVDDIGTIKVLWDNGRMLGVLPEDVFEIID